MLTPDYPNKLYGGIGIHVKHLADKLTSLGNTVDVVVARFNIYIDAKIIEFFDGNVHVFEFMENSNIDFKTQKNINYCTHRYLKNNSDILETLLKLYDDGNYNIVHCHDYYFAFFADIILKKYHKKVVTTIHSLGSPESFIEDSIRRYICLNSSHLVFVSKTLCKETREHYRFSTQEKIIYNGISPSTNLNNYKNENLLSFCGRLNSYKGCDTLIRAFHILKQKLSFPELKLIIIGDGHKRQELEQLVVELGLHKYVNFTGYINNEKAREYIHQAMVHIVPSNYEPFGISVLEAMSEKTCVIASNVGGISEIIEDTVDGLLFQAGNFKELAKKIMDILNNKALRTNIIQNGYEKSIKMNWENVAYETLDVYKKTMD